MSDGLPEGFEVEEPTKKPAAASGLPEGFEVAAPHEESVLPAMWDHFKKGVGNMLATPGVALDAALAINNGDENKPGATQQMMEKVGLGDVRGKVRRAVGLDKAPSLSDLVAGKKPGSGGLKRPHAAEAISSTWDKLVGVHNLPAPKDLAGGESKANEYLVTISEFVGGSIIPGASAVNAAERKLATAVVSTLGIAASGMGAVEGKEIGKKIGPSMGLSEERSAQIGEIAGSLTGPGAVGMAGQALLKGGGIAKAAARSQDITGFSKDAQKAAADSMLARDIQRGLEHAPQSAQNLARSLELSKKVEGWNPTIAQASNAPGLVAMQKEVANKSGEALAKAAAVDRRNLEAIANHKNKVFPGEARRTETNPATGRSYVVDPVTDPARVKLSVNKQVRQMEIGRNERELRTLSDQYRRVVDNEAIGEKLRVKYWEARGTAKIQQDVAMADVYSTAAKYGIKEDMTDVRDAINKIVTSDRQTFQDMPPLFGKVLNEYPAAAAAKIERKAVTPLGAKKPIFKTTTTPATEGRSEASFEELHSLYKQANKDWADATAAGNSTKAHYMALIRDQLGAKVNKFGGPQYGELATKFQEFNQGYAKYSRTFKEGAGGEIAKRGKNGISRDAEDIVTRTILKAGDKKKGVQDFFAVYGNDKEAAGLLADGLTDSFSRAAMKSGTFDPKAANGWLKQHESAMRELPELKGKFEKAQSLGTELVNRQLVLQKQARMMDRTVLAKVAQTSNPDALIRKALGDSKDGPKVLKALLVGATEPEQKASIARAIVDTVGGQGLEFVMQHEATLKPVMEQLGKGHWENLKDIAEMESIAKRVTAPSQVELSKLQDLGEQTVGTSVKGLFARAMAAKQGRISEGYAVMDVGGRWFYKIRAEEVTRLREAAMFDPDLAGLLAKMGRGTGAPTKEQLLDLQRLSFNAGIISTSEATAHAREREKERQKHGN